MLPNKRNVGVSQSYANVVAKSSCVREIAFQNINIYIAQKDAKALQEKAQIITANA